MMAASRHRLVNPPELARPVGFAHAVVAAPGRQVFLGGQTAHRADGTMTAGSLVAQVNAALGNLVTALAAAGGAPQDLTAITVYTTRGAEYRENLDAIGHVYRRRLGRHYPAMAFFEVAGLFDPAAQIEFLAVAVVPE